MANSNVLLIPGAYSSQRASVVLSSKELVYDYDLGLIFYGDGAALGGISLATGGGGGVVGISGSNGSFTYSTLTAGALNGITFYTSNGSLVASYNSTQYQQSSLMTNYLGTTYTSHTHSQYLNTSQSSLFQQTSNTSNITSNALNTSQSSLFQQTSLMTNYLGTAATQSFRFTSNDSQLLFTSQSSLFQATSDNSLSLGTDYTTHTHSQYINTSQSSLFQQTSLMSDYLGTAATQSFRHTSNDTQLLFTSQSSLFQATSDNSLSLGTDYTSHTHSQYLNTSQSSLFEQSSHTTIFLTSQSNQAVSAANGSVTFQTLRFVDGQGVSFSTDSNGVNATVKTDYLTTAMASNAGSNFINTTAALNLTNISVTLGSNALSFSVNPGGATTFLSGIAASDTTYTSGNVSLRDGNGITFATTTGQGISITHGLQFTSNTSQITSLALNTSQSSLFQHTSATTAITANALNTSQSSLFQHTSATSAITSNALHTSLSTRFAGTGTTTAGTNISLSLTLNSVGLNLAASVNPGGGGGIALANSQTTYTSGTAHLSAAGALTIQSTTGQSYQFSVPATSSLSGTGHLSISANGSTISLGVPSPAVSGSNGSFSYSTLSFGASNGFTFYTTNGSVVGSYTTASAAPSPINFSAGTTSNDLGSVVFSNSNGITFGLNGSTITASHNGITSQSVQPVAVSGSNGSFTYETLSFANINNHTFYTTNGSIAISQSIDSVAPRSFYNPYGDLMMVAGQVGQGTLNINPNVMPAITFDRILMPINNTNSSNSSGSHTLSFWVGIYTLNASTLSLLTSNSASYAITHSGTAGSYSLYSGMRQVSIPMSTSLSEGRYYLGVLSRTTSGGANGSYSQFQVSNLATNFLGIFGSSHNTTYQFQPGLGVYSATTSGIPATIAISQIRGSDSLAQRPPIVVFANSTF